MRFKTQSTILIIALSLAFTNCNYAFASTATDSFTDTAGVSLESHVSNSGNTWSRQNGSSGTTTITVAGRLAFNSTGGVIDVSNWIPFSADYDVSADLRINDTNVTYAGVAGRAGTTSFTGYYALLSGDKSVKLFRGGNATPLASTSVSVAAGQTHTIKLSMRGSNIQIYWDGASIISVTPSGSDLITSVGNSGLYAQGSSTDSVGVELDNFSATDAPVDVLTAGTLSESGHSASTATLSWTAAAGGVSPVSAQLQHSAHGAGSWSNILGATTSPATDIGLASSTSYDYRVAYTDASSTVAYSNTVTVTTQSGILTNYEKTILSESNLLYYWPMNDGTGDTILNAATGSVPIILNNATANVSGQTGPAVSFTGSSSYAVTQTNLNLSSYNKIVVEAIMAYTYNGSGGVGWELSPNVNTTTDGFMFLPVEPSSLTNSNLLLKGDAGYNYALYARPTANTWHHIVAVFNKAASLNEVDLYVDGVLQSAASRPATVNNSNNFGNNLLYLMSRGGSSLFTQGALQHLAIYSDISSTSILAHYQSAFSTSSAVTAGTLSESGHSASTATLSWTAAAGGVSPVSAQLQHSAHGAGSWSNISGATTSPATDIGLASSTSYDYRVAYTDASSTVAYSNTVTVTTDGATSTYTVQRADLWDNGYDNVTAPRQSTFARFVFTTDAGNITVIGNTTLYASYPQYAHLGVLVNGVALPPLTFTANGNQSFNVSLGSAGTLRTIQIITGLQSTAGGANSLGSFITSVAYPATSTFSIQSPTTQPNRILFYGDSISVGGNSTNPEYQAYVTLLRTTYGYSTMLEGWGYRALYDDANTGALQTTFANRLASYNPSTIWFAIGTNDYGLNKWSAANFGTAYAAVLDQLHSASPSARIVCQTPIVRSSESANSFGNTTGDYRSQIITACNARPWTTLVDGTSILTLSDLADGVHPTTAGHVKYAQQINAVLTITPTASTSAASTVLANSVTMNGAITALGSTTPIIRGFNYGTTTAYSATTTETGSFTTGSFSTTTLGLASNTLYHYRAYATNFGGTSYGSDQTFTTAIVVSVPVMTNLTPSSVTANAAILNAAIIADGNASSTIEGFRYGLTTLYGSTASSTGTFGVGPFSQTLTGLTCNTTYHYQAFATNTAGTATTSDQTFTTAPCPVSVPVQTSYPAGGGGGSVFIYSLVNMPIATPSTPNMSEPIFSRSLARNSIGSDVKALQIFLNTHGYPVVSSGVGSKGNESQYFGKATTAALMKFQADHNLPATGYFGSLTQAVVRALVNETTPPQVVAASSTSATFVRDLIVGSFGPDVKALQIYLNAHGFIVASSGPGSTGNESSYFGAATTGALSRFQKAHNISATGLFGPVTRTYIQSN